MTEYVVSAVDATEPNDDRPASYLGIEMRTLKAHNNSVNQAQGETNTSVAEDLAAIEALFNTATGVTGLPAGKGVLNVLLALYKEVFGYTEGSTVVPSLAAKIEALSTNITNTVNGTLSQLTNTVNQHSTSINTLNNTVGQHSTALSNHGTLLNSHTQSINNINTSITNLQNAPSSKLPVGFVFMTTNSANPSTYLGYGTWVATNQGRIPVGVGNNIAGTGYNIGQAGVNYGERSINIAANNIPEHSHSYSGLTDIVRKIYANGAQTDSSYSFRITTAETGKFGSSPVQPLPIYPPMVGYYFWKRVS